MIIVKTARVLALAVFLSSLGNAHATTLSLDMGTLQIGSTNNEFLFQFGNMHNGTYLAQIFFSTSSTGVVQQNSSPYPNGDGQLFSFEFPFIVTSAAVLSLNPIYQSFIAAGSSSVSLLQGSTVVANGITDAPASNGGYWYSFPTTPLLADTPYTMVLTGRAPSSVFSGNYGGSAQIALDVSPVPEPQSYLLFMAALGFFGLRRNFRVAPRVSPRN